MSTFDAGAIESKLTVDRDPFQAGLDAARQEARKFQDETITKTIRISRVTEDDRGAVDQPTVEDQTQTIHISSTGIEETRAQIKLLNDDLNRVPRVIDIRTDVSEDHLRSLQAALRDTQDAIDKIDTKRAQNDLDDLGNAATKAKGNAGSGDDGDGVSGLLQAILLLGPTLIPLSAAAIGLGGAIASLGGAAYLGVSGIKAEVAAGTELGKQFSLIGQNLITVRNQLEAKAAPGFLGPALDITSKLNAQVPQLSQYFTGLSYAGGRIVDNLLSGLITGFTKLEPLFTASVSGIEQLSAAFNRSTQGNGLVDFVSYAEKEIPVVVSFLENLFTVAGHVVQGLAPLGGATLSTLGAVSKVLAQLPPSAITAIATAYTAYAIAAKGAAIAQALVNNAVEGGAAGKLAAAGGFASKAIAGYLAVSVAANVATQATDSWSTSTNSAQRYTSVFFKAISDTLTQGPIHAWENAGAAARKFGTDAGIAANAAADQAKMSDTAIANFVRSTNGLNDAVIKGNISRSASFVQSGASLADVNDEYDKSITTLQAYLKNAQALDGVGKGQQVTFLGQSFAADQWNTALQKTNGTSQAAYALLMGNRDAVKLYTDAINQDHDAQVRVADATNKTALAYKLTAQQVSDYSKIIGINTAGVASGAITADSLSTAVGSVVDKFKNATAANVEWNAEAAKFDAATATSADKAQLLEAALKAVRGTTLDLATSNLQASQAVENVGETLGKYSASVSKNGTLLGQLTDVNGKYIIQQPKLTAGSLAIAQALSQQADAATAMAGQTYQNARATMNDTDATNAAISVYQGYRNGLIQTAIQSGLTKAQAKALADQYLALPPDKVTQIKQLGADNVQTAIADLTAALNNLSAVIAKPTVSTENLSNASTTVATLYKNLLGISNTTWTASLIVNELNKIEGKNTDATSGIPGAPRARGGLIGAAFAGGGEVRGPGGHTSDTILTPSSAGEFMVNAQSYATNKKLVQYINASSGPVNIAQALGVSAALAGRSVIVPSAASTTQITATAAASSQQALMAQMSKLAATMADAVPAHDSEASTQEMIYLLREIAKMTDAQTDRLGYLGQIGPDVANALAGATSAAGRRASTYPAGKRP